MPNYKVSLDALTATANAIRTKTGGSSGITWDGSTGFASAISSISGGGSATVYTIEGYADEVVSVDSIPFDLFSQSLDTPKCVMCEVDGIGLFHFGYVGHNSVETRGNLSFRYFDCSIAGLFEEMELAFTLVLGGTPSNRTVESVQAVQLLDYQIDETEILELSDYLGDWKIVLMS